MSNMFMTPGNLIKGFDAVGNDPTNVSTNPDGSLNNPYADVASTVTGAINQDMNTGLGALAKGVTAIAAPLAIAPSIAGALGGAAGGLGGAGGSGLSSLVSGLAGPAINGLIGAGLNAGAASAGTNTNQNTSGSSITAQTQGQTGTSTIAPNQNPLFKAYQESLIPQFHNALAQAQQPIFGDAQKATYLGGLNDLANASTSHLASTLASRGQLDSGALASGQADIENNRVNQYGTFLGQLPFEEAQMHNQNVNQLLGLNTAFASSAPVGQTTSQSGNTTLAGTNSTTGQTLGNINNGGFLSNLMGNVGNLFAAGGLGIGGGVNNGGIATPNGGFGSENDPNSLSNILNGIGYNPVTTPPFVPANPFG